MTAAITPETTVSTIATSEPLSTRVFARHNIDYCCGGGRALAEVCSERGLDVGSVIGEIEAEIGASSGGAVTRWTEEPLDALCDHIVGRYHVPLREELPRIQEMAEKVERVHGDKEPERLPELAATVRAIRAELESHMVKEEQVLFPMISAGRGASAGAPIGVMEHEHDEVAQLLRRARELTDDFQPPAAACTTWRALWGGLEELERVTHEHIHLENNILFPRALESAGVGGG